ncbi:hypothetical protein ACFU8I_02755 [Streptomyces sp. NPDC057540]|uniref:hypothetical protein n=1 Tax=Streptomyces sp. NPDC057540 TaxID=3346160 RepID=UPI003673E370
MTQPTTRVRLYGGRHTHAARPGRGTTYRTPCGHLTTRNDHWLPDTEPVTCPACNRTLARTEAPR